MIDFQVRMQTGEQKPEIIAEGSREAMVIIRQEKKEQFKENTAVRVWMTPSPNRNENRGGSIQIECENRTGEGLNILGFGISSIKPLRATKDTSGSEVPTKSEITAQSAQKCEQGEINLTTERR